VPQRLKSILFEIGGRSPSVIRNCQLLSLWPQIVDERVTKNTSPIKIKNGVLHVATATAVWAQELSFYKDEIVAKFNQKAGEKVITDVRFRSTE
jgi:predicted nucleic acid-binding Zn ribbon protein